MIAVKEAQEEKFIFEEFAAIVKQIILSDKTDTKLRDGLVRFCVDLRKNLEPADTRRVDACECEAILLRFAN